MMKTWIRLPAWIESWLQWMTVTAVGWPLAVVVGMGVCAAIRPLLPWTADLAIGCILGGLLIAFIQSFVQHQEVRGFLWWTLATVVGWTAGLAILAGAVEIQGPTWRWALAGAAGGLAAGTTQSLAFHAQFRQKMGWMAISALAWGAAFSIGFAINSSNMGIGMLNFAGVLATGMLGWVILSMLAIILLVAFFPRAEQGDPNVNIEWFPSHRT
jgi:hypothetical protein